MKEPHTDRRPLHLGRAFASLKDLLRSLRFRRSLSAYLASSLFYRDALNALYGFGGVYASGVLGWSIIQIGIFGIVGAVTAMVAAFIGGRLDRAFGPKPVIMVSIVVLIAVLGRHSRLAAWLIAPYLAWVSFAAYLNYTIVQLNQPFG